MNTGSQSSLRNTEEIDKNSVFLCELCEPVFNAFCVGILRGRIFLQQQESMKWLLVAAVCILPFCLSAQATDYKFMRYDIRDGVSHNSANCFWQDRQGFLWIGTRSGLNCFDGHSFKVFHNDLHDTTSLASDAIASMSEDPDGRIWINHTDVFSIYDPTTERFYRNADAQARAYGLPNAQLTKFLRTKTKQWVAG